MRLMRIDPTHAAPLGNAPRWAVLMRQLLSRMPAAVETVRSRYLAPDGSVLWPQPENAAGGLIDGLDDAYESFHSWPLAYLLGADEALLRHGESGFDAVTRQFSSIPTGHGHPMVVSGYEQGYDWFHQGEGYMLFYYLCAAAPEREVNRERAARFAGFLLNRGVPEPNFDFDTLHFRSPHIGSMGPAFRNFETNSLVYKALLRYYGLPFQSDRVGADAFAFFDDPGNVARYARMASDRLKQGDCATNLNATSMAINAWLVTGESAYRDWALEYIEGWMRKADENSGILPDNVGPSGKIGELMDGNWFGGYYGWVWPHGWHSLGKVVTVAMQNALLLTGDSKYPAFLRRHIEHLADRAILNEGTAHVPHKHGAPGWYDYDTSIPMLAETLRDPEGPITWKDGWFEFRAMHAQFPVWLWEMTGDPRDAELLVRLRNHRTEDWKSILPVAGKDLGGHQAAWFAYLRGEFPDYPERILEHGLALMDERLEKIASDTQDPRTYGDSYLQARNPIANESLFHLTLGASMPVYNGGLIHSRLRHFDADRHRPGLPPDVAALVERMDADLLDLHLVNLSEFETRRDIIRAGFFAEHRWVGVEILDGQGSSVASVEGPPVTDLLCELPPKSSLRLRLRASRYAGSPQMGGGSTF